MYASCLVSNVQAGGGGIMVWGIFSWQSGSHSLPEYYRWSCLYLGYPSSDGWFQQNNTLYHKAQNISDSDDMTWQWVYCTQMASTVTRYHSNRVPLVSSKMENLHHGCEADKFPANACWRVKMRNVSSTFLNLCHKELRLLWRKRRV